MTTQRYEITDEQHYILDKNRYIKPVSFLDDGDLLILEPTDPMTAPYEGGRLALYQAYVLTVDGDIQGMSYHHERHHDLSAPWRPPQADQPVGVTLATTPDIISAAQAAQLLLIAYRVDVTSRTVRNWLRDGKLAGGQLGSADTSPWYTTARAIDQAAGQAWFPSPMPEVPPRPAAGELDARAELATDALLGHLLADVDEGDNDELR
jgi:hypothetical protein